MTAAHVLRPALIPPVLALAWGLNWPAVKIVLGTLAPFSFRALGLLSAALLLMLVAVLRGQRLWPPRAAWPGIAIGALLTVGAFNICTAFAQLATSTARATVLTYAMPMISAVLAWAWLGERPSVRARWALALGSAGIGVLAWPALARLGGTASASWAGIALPLAAATAWAIGTVAAKRWPPVGSRLVHTAWQLAGGGVCALVGALSMGESLPSPALWPWQVQVATAFHIVFAMAMAYALWFSLLEQGSTAVSALTTLAVPVVGVLGAMALVGDRPSALDWAGFALVLSAAALVLVQRPARS